MDYMRVAHQGSLANPPMSLTSPTAHTPMSMTNDGSIVCNWDNIVHDDEVNLRHVRASLTSNVVLYALETGSVVEGV